MHVPLGGDTLLRLFPLLPKSFLQIQLLGLFRVFCLVALVAAGVADTALETIPGGGDQLTILSLRTFHPQRQFSALGTGKAVLPIVGHVLDPADLFLEFPALFLIIKLAGLIKQVWPVESR